MGFWDFLGNVEHDVGHAANTVEHGTFNFLKPVGNAVAGIAKTAEHVAAIPYNAAKEIPAAITGNATAEQNASAGIDQGVNDLVKFGQAIPRGIVQLRQSAASAIDPNNPTTGDVTPPSSGIGHALLGDAPIPTLQHQFEQTKQQTGSTAEAAGGTLLSFLGDYAGGKGAVSGAVKAGEAGASAATSLAENATPLNEIGAIGKNVTTDNLNKLSDANTLKDVHATLDTIVPPEVAAKIAPAILETKDPGVIDNIITHAITPAADHPPIGETVTPPPALVPSSKDVNAIPEAQLVPPRPEAAPAEVTPPPAVTEPASPGTQERGYTTSQKAVDQYSPELKAAIGGNYVVSGDKPAFEAANKLIDKQGVDATHQQILEKLQSSSQVTKQDIITGGQVVSHLDAQGRVAEGEQLHQLLSERGTTSGQVSEAFGALLRRSPEGLVYKAKNDITKAGGEVTSEVQQTLDSFKENLKQTAPGSPERKDSVDQLGQYVLKQAPASATDKIFAVWRAGLLTGPQTVTKIITSHVAHGAFEDVSQNVVGAGIDKFVSLISGQRALVASARGGIEGAKSGASAGKELITQGLDRNPGSNAAELHQTVNFGDSIAGKTFQKYVDTVGHIHGALYKPFYGKAYAQSMYNQAITAAKNAGAKGADREPFIQNFLENASGEARDIAKKEAERYTFQQETQLGNVASAIQKKGGIVGKVLAPFTRIPSAIATNLINASPIGIAKTIIDGIKAAKSDTGWTIQAQREFSQGLGRGITGTAAIIPGLMLFNKELMTLEYPTDPKEQKLWQLEGKIPNAVKIGGQWRSLGSIGPSGSVLAIGGHIANSLKGGNDLGTALLAGLSGGLRSVESQSYLQGISGSLNALNDPGRYGKNFVKSEAGSVIPTISNTVAKSVDPYARQTNTPLDAIKSRIPGLSETLPAKVDSLGQPVKSPETGIEKLLDPFQSSTVRSSPVISELQRLQDAGQGITPSTVNKKITFNGVNTQITPDQQRQLTEAIGKSTLERWQKIVSQPGYQHASDQQKSARLKSSFDIISTHQKILFAKNNKIGRYSASYATNRAQTRLNKKFVAKQGG